ncbi:MAG: glycosyltransferase family 4 protein [bacterium]
MKVVQILASTGYGGLERHFVELSIALSETIEIHCIAHPEFASYFENTKVIFHPCDLSGWRFNPLKHLKLRKLLKTIQADIIHAQANKAAAIASWHLGMAKASLATMHNQKSSTSMFNKYQQLIAVSNEVQKCLSHPKVQVIANGIQPVERIEQHKLNAIREQYSPDQPILLAVGRLVEAKGFDLLIPAMKAVDAHLLIAGTGPDQQKLEQLLQRHELNNVTLLGYRSDVSALMQACDVMIISSRKEGFPYVLIEALHNQCVTLSTPIPGAQDYLPEEAVINNVNSENMRHKIIGTLNKYLELKAQFNPFHQKAIQELSLDYMSQQVLDLYRGLIE